MSSLSRPHPPHYCAFYSSAIPLKTDICLKQLIMDDDPPSYASIDDPLAYHKTVSTLALAQVDSFFHAPPLPPTINYFVRSDKPPSSWKLLSGPCLSNATTEIGDTSRKRRYRIVYPTGYEDVYLHKSFWMSNTSSLPRYVVKTLGQNRYEPEPIVIMGPCDLNEDRMDTVKKIALAHVAQVCSRVEDEVSKTTRYATFCEMEFFSWDWQCKTENARLDMRHLIDKGKEKCVVGESLVFRLERFLEFVDKREMFPEEMRILRRNIAEASRRLERLRL